jgi:hypothetical protein
MPNDETKTGKPGLIVKELSELIGTELTLSSDNICELDVDGHVTILRYRPEDDDWLFFGLVTDDDEPPSRKVLEKALSLNLFGAGTHGLHLGLFGNALVLSDSIPSDGLTAETLAEKLLFLSRQIASVLEKIGEESSDLNADDSDLLPFSSNFMQV